MRDYAPLDKKKLTEIVSEMIREEYTPEAPCRPGPSRSRDLADRILTLALHLTKNWTKADYEQEPTQ